MKENRYFCDFYLKILSENPIVYDKIFDSYIKITDPRTRIIQFLSNFIYFPYFKKVLALAELFFKILKRLRYLLLR